MKKNKDNTGVYQKYIVAKANGKPIDKNAKYMVLRYDRNDEYGLATRTALFLFARLIRPFAKQFSRQLKDKIELKEMEIQIENR